MEKVGYSSLSSVLYIDSREIICLITSKTAAKVLKLPISVNFWLKILLKCENETSHHISKA